MQDLTRRSFLQGLTALSVVAAVPMALVKTAKAIYADDTPLKNFPAYILINNEPITFSNLWVHYPHNPLHVVGSPDVRLQNLMPKKIPSIEIIHSFESKFFRELTEFNFEIVYDDIFYSIRGSGIKEYCEGWTSDAKLFRFIANVEKYDKKRLLLGVK